MLTLERMCSQKDKSKIIDYSASFVVTLDVNETVKAAPY